MSGKVHIRIELIPLVAKLVPEVIELRKSWYVADIARHSVFPCKRGNGISLGQEDADFIREETEQSKQTDDEATYRASAHDGVPSFHARMRRPIDGSTDSVSLEVPGPRNMMLRMCGAKCSDIGHNLPPFLFRQHRGDEWLHPGAWNAVFDYPKQLPILP